MSWFKSKTILITGGSGFLGCGIASRLQGSAARQIIRLGRKPGSDVNALCDLRNLDQVIPLVSSLRPDLIFHCAGTFSNEWAEDFANNVDATHNLLSAVAKSGCATKVILFGSAAEYGVKYSGPVHEDAPACPISIYGTTKVMQTALMAFFFRAFHVDVSMARLFNLYGPGISPLLFPGKIEEQIASVRLGLQTRIQVRTLGGCRDYIPLDDAIPLIFRIAQHGAAGEVYNVGSGRPTSNMEMVKNLLTPAGLSFEQVEPADPDTCPGTCAWADLSKTSQLPPI